MSVASGVQEPAKPAVWVFVGVYLVVLLIIGGFFIKRNQSKVVTPKDHFLAGKNLGIVVITLSLFASQRSGYTEVGAPGEGYAQGWYVMRWIPSDMFIFCWITWLAPRMHFYAHRRDYEGTADFIADRYRNHILSVLLVMFSVFPVCLYVMGQLKGVGTTMSAMTGYVEGQPSLFDGGQGLPEFWGAAIFIVIMLFYEMVGGLAAIALTDVIQSCLLTFGFFLYLILQNTTFGGIPSTTDALLQCARLYDTDYYRVGELYLTLNELAPEVTAQEFLDLTAQPDWAKDEWWADYEEGDWKKEGLFSVTKTEGAFEFQTGALAPLYMDQGEHSCELPADHVVRPETAASRLTVDSKKLNVGWVGRNIGSMPFIIYPHIMDRYYAAKDERSMRSSLILLQLGTYIASLPCTLMGYCVSNTPGLTNVANSNAVFANFMEYIINLNDFLYFVGCLILSAAFAAYMSTADSGLMGFSSALTLDIAKHYVPPFNNADDPNRGRNLVYLGKAMSLIGAFIALSLTTIEGLNFPLADLFVWQGSFLFQCFPAYVIGFFCRWVCSWSILTGFLCGVTILISFTNLYDDGDVGGMSNSFWAMLVNLGMILVAEGVLRLANMHPGFEPMVKKEFCGFGEMPEGYIGLSVAEVGGPKREPFQPLWASAIAVICAFLAIPYWAQLDEYEVTYIAGAPYWAVITICITAVGTIITMLQVTFCYDDWMTEEDRKKHQVDPETELGDMAKETATADSPKAGEAGAPAKGTVTVDNEGGAGSTL